jgi:Tfp pilus assembly protein PilV
MNARTQSLIARRQRRACHRLMAAEGSRRRTGMTLVEVIVAMMLLVGVLFALGGFMAKFAQANSQAQFTLTANELAARRLDVVRSQPTYASLDTVANTTNVKSDFKTFAVKTAIKRIGGGALDSLDYKAVTVTVTHPSMKKDVAKTTAVAAF